MSIEGTICLFAILEVLKCAENQEYCDGIRKINYSRPILMQVSNLSLKLYLYYILTYVMISPRRPFSTEISYVRDIIVHNCDYSYL